MDVHGKQLILKGKRQVVLEKENVDLIAIWEEKDLEQCVEFKGKEFVCNHDLFILYPVNNFKCIHFMLNKGNELCEYDELNDDFKIELIKDKIYLYTKKEESAILNCKGKEERMKIINLHVFPRECNLKIINMMYYTPTIFQEVKLNSSFHTGSFKVNVNEINLPKVMTVAEEYQWHNVGFFYVYKNKVMPVMTLIIFPLMIVFGIFAILFVKYMLVKKITIIKNMLKESNDE